MRRIFLMASGLILAFVLAIAGTASADTTLGSTAIPSGSSAGVGCGTNQVIAQFTDNPSDPYFVPAPGRLTQWQTNTTGAAPGSPVTLVVLRPASGGSFTVVGADSRNLPSPLPSGNVATFPLATPITVAPGDTLGLDTQTAVCAWFGGAVPAASKLVALTEPSPPAAGQTLNQRSSSPISPGGYTMDVAANLAPTGERAAALNKCKKRAHKHHWTKKRLRKCKRKANLLPV